MNNLTKIAALPTGGGCQSALRPEDRGAEQKRRMERLQLCGGFMEVLALPGDQMEAVSVEPGEWASIGARPMLTVNFHGIPIEFDAEQFRRDWCADNENLVVTARAWPELCRADLKGGGA
ncbi:hypothetical protein [Variovorax sp. N23]|uniref:hypothetical protein n=1 Tax=Variovorax sp. N23 TaxID=2980555 RepID=UPI0021C7988E|nr:hypothetical protein [Variovorax sp. N23]MCU4119321.1 hypothetical protein [Variovorax sp. N23]